MWNTALLTVVNAAIPTLTAIGAYDMTVGRKDRERRFEGEGRCQWRLYDLNDRWRVGIMLVTFALDDTRSEEHTSELQSRI